MEFLHGTLTHKYVWSHEFARFQEAEMILSRTLGDR